MNELGTMLQTPIGASRHGTSVRSPAARGTARAEGSKFSDTFKKACSESADSSETVKGAQPRTATTAKTENAENATEMPTENPVKNPLEKLPDTELPKFDGKLSISIGKLRMDIGKLTVDVEALPENEALPIDVGALPEEEALPIDVGALPEEEALPIDVGALPEDEALPVDVEALPKDEALPVDVEALPKDEALPVDVGALPEDEALPVDVGALPKDEALPVDVGALPEDEALPVDVGALPKDEALPVDVEALPKDEALPVDVGALPEDEALPVDVGAFPKDEALPVDIEKLPEDDEKLPDELAALAALPNRLIYTLPTQDAEATANVEPPQVISILESNTEIEALHTTVDKNVEIDPEEFKAAMESAKTGDGELTARMPQKTGQLDTPDVQVTVKTVVDGNAEDSSPLENINNVIAPQTQTQAKTTTDQGGAESDEDNTQDDDSLISKQPQVVDISPERFAAAESMSKAAATPELTKTATPETLMSTVIDSIEMTNTSETKFMEISLKPEYLGKVAIQLTLSDGGLEIRIKADDNGVKSLLAGQLSQLTESLESKGVKITNIDVVQTNIADHTYGDSHQQGQGRNRGTARGSHSRGIAADFGFTDEQEPVSVIDTLQSSVSYIA